MLLRHRSRGRWLTRQVVDALVEEYYNVNANVHRGVHYLSQQATDLHEAARERVRQFINAEKTEEIVFTRGTTESLNLVAATFEHRALAVAGIEAWHSSSCHTYDRRRAVADGRV